MNKHRLRTLQKFLRTKVNPDRFDMEEWAGEIKNGKPACGTSACALGWATTIPSFRKAGLRMTKTKQIGYIYVTITGMRHNYTKEQYSSHVSLHRSLKAAMKFFDITYTEADYIFANDVYTCGQEGIELAIGRIEDVLDNEIL